MLIEKGAVRTLLEKSLRCVIIDCGDRSRLYAPLLDGMVARLGQPSTTDDESYLIKLVDGTCPRSCKYKGTVGVQAYNLLEQIRSAGPVYEQVLPILLNAGNGARVCIGDPNREMILQLVALDVAEDMQYLAKLSAAKDNGINEIERWLHNRLPEYCGNCRYIPDLRDALADGIERYFRGLRAAEARAGPIVRTVEKPVFNDHPETRITRAKQDYVYTVVMELGAEIARGVKNGETQSGIVQLRAHEVMMACRVLKACGLNVFTENVTGMDDATTTSLEAFVRSEMPQWLFDLAKPATATAFEIAIKLLHHAWVVNSPNESQSSRVDAFDELVRLHRRYRLPGGDADILAVHEPGIVGIKYLRPLRGPASGILKRQEEDGSLVDKLRKIGCESPEEIRKRILMALQQTPTDEMCGGEGFLLEYLERVTRETTPRPKQ